jgi:hypothetical protein
MSPARNRELVADFDATFAISIIDVPLGVVRHTCDDANIRASLNQVLGERAPV